MLKHLCRSREFRLKLEQSRSRIYGIAYSWCHSPELADDLTQETLSKALRRSAQLNELAKMDGWLFRILANCWHDYLRARRENVEYEEERHQHQATPERLSLRNEEILAVREAVSRLNVLQREVVTLVDIEGFSYLEVAKILDIPVGTVMSRLCRARRMLKDELLGTVPAKQDHIIPFRRSR